MRDSIRDSPRQPVGSGDKAFRVAYPEEMVYLFGFIDSQQLEMLAKQVSKNAYGNYISNILGI